MTPVYISSCFGILHPARGGRAALICGPLSDEALNSYRPLVFLAEQLAEAGMPALRLAYYGTGDSAGNEGEGNFAQWLDSIRAGVAWMREHCGTEAVTLIGHRIGASLIARAACDIDAVDSIVLLAQVSGRHFLHELTLSARIAQRVWQTNHRVDDGTWFESHGLRIDRTTRRELNALDIGKLEVAPAAQALVLDSKDSPAVRQVVEGLQRVGTTTKLEIFADLDRMQRDSYEAEVPCAAFDSAVAWMRCLPSQPDAPHRAYVPDVASLTLKDTNETAIRFGPDNALFGVLSMPHAPAPGAPAVLLVSTSANPRWGNSRIPVIIARSLGADGVALLRMDGCGMGDTAPNTGERGRPYSEAATNDVRHGVAELARRTGRPVVILGLCSGAYHALQASVSDPLVGGLALVNLQRFVWHEGDPSDVVRRSALRPNRFYLRNLLNARAWLRLLRADFDVANLARVFAARLLRRAVATADPILGRILGGVTRVGRVRRMVGDVTTRGLPVLYVLGCNDPGIEELAEYFGRDGWRLSQQQNVTFRLLHDADHIFGAYPVRAALIQEIRDWYRRSWHVEARPPVFPSLTDPARDVRPIDAAVPRDRPAKQRLSART